MNPAGKLVASRRKQLGLSREQLAQRINVTSQSILNIESNEEYNLSPKIFRALEIALDVEFRIEMKEKTTVSDRIKMGNDEFILYIRKTNKECQINNRILGKRIWEWLQANAGGVKLFDGKEQSCVWGGQADHVGELGLPKTATQFEFDINALPGLFRFLDTVALKQSTRKD